MKIRKSTLFKFFFVILSFAYMSIPFLKIHLSPTVTERTATEPNPRNIAQEQNRTETEVIPEETAADYRHEENHETLSVDIQQKWHDSLKDFLRNLERGKGITKYQKFLREKAKYESALLRLLNKRKDFSNFSEAEEIEVKDDQQLQESNAEVEALQTEYHQTVKAIFQDRYDDVKSFYLEFTAHFAASTNNIVEDVGIDGSFE